MCGSTGTLDNVVNASEIGFGGVGWGSIECLARSCSIFYVDAATSAS